MIEIVSHIIVDQIPRDEWAVTAALAAIAAAILGIIGIVLAMRAISQAKNQTKLAEKALDAAERELTLAEEQLKSTEAASRQTQESLELGRKQLEYLQRADVDRARALAPRVTAEMKLGAQADRYVMHLFNSGAVASYLLVTGRDADGDFHNEFLQKLDPGETKPVTQFFSKAKTGSYCQYIRIRTRDLLGNKYITEYRSLGAALAYPVFRAPWIGEGIVERPKRCSEEVAWPVEHFERMPGQPDEAVEPGFNIEAPA